MTAKIVLNLNCYYTKIYYNIHIIGSVEVTGGKRILLTAHNEQLIIKFIISNTTGVITGRDFLVVTTS